LGDWGEKFILNQLKTSHKDYSSVTWMNESSEVYAPYDLTANYKGEQILIEVKTTSQINTLIPFGVNQIVMGMEKNSQYHVFVVFVNFLKNSVKYLSISNFSEFLIANKVYLKIEDKREIAETK
jgi:hypothetical protein